MKNLEKISKWLTTFKNEERKKFKNWINKLSPQRKNRTKKLVDYIWNCIDNDEVVTIEEVSKRIYGKTTYDRKQLNNYLLKTWDIIEEFLVHNYYLNDRSRRLNALHDLARNRKLQDEFEELNKTFLTDNTLHIGSEGYFRKYMLQSKNYFSEWNLTGKVKKTRVEFRELSKSLEEVYIIAKLQLMCEAVSRRKIINEEIDHKFFINILEKADEYKYENPLILLYLQVYDLLTNHIKISIIDLKELFIENYKLLHENEQVQLLIKITNHLIRESIKHNDKSTIIATYEFYKLRFTLVPFDKYEELSPYWFINLVNMAISLKDLEWIKWFKKTYVVQLPEEVQELTFKLSTAMVLHKEEKFQAAFTLLKNLKSRDLNFALRIHIYKTMCLFDHDFMILNNRNDVRESCHNFKKLLERNKDFFGQNVRNQYLNYITFLQKILSLDADLDLIKHQLNNTKNVAAPNWLNRKIEQMKKRSRFIV